jgi:hypothetical protein
MVTASEKATFQRIASLTGWAVADHFGCSYSGDSDPIDHGGFFYDARDWDRYGYARVVDFWTDPDDDGVLNVSRGTVLAPSADQWPRVWSCCGIADPADRANLHCQIDAARAHFGMEPDGTRYPDVLRFRFDDWTEWRIWRSIAPWLAALAS